MEPIEAAFASTLERFEFAKHRANRWLLLERSRREAILDEAGLLDIIDCRQRPVHVGNIAHVDQHYEWGQVVFQGLIPQMGSDHPCSVYAAFEFLIRKCDLFPSFISLADLGKCDKTGLDVLPVYGAPFTLGHLDPGQRQARLKQMLQLHNIEPRNGLLIEQVCEVSDSELFEQYFREMVDSKQKPAKRPAGAGDAAGTGLDDIDIWHT